ncbi:PQQ-binding-like beta-propeller repeat protein [Planctomycetaceae bacterium SH139]
MALANRHVFGGTWMVASLLSALASAEDWSQFRGSDSTGIAATACPAQWNVSDESTENLLWKVAVAGEGWSSPIIWGDAVFLTAAVPLVDDQQEAAAATKPVEYRGGGGTRRDDLTKTVYRYQVICLDATTGALRWQSVADERQPPLPRHSSNTYATETPVTDGERVYAYFGMTGVFCFDMQGNQLWSRDLGSYSMRAGWGTSSSPVLFAGKLFLQIDNDQQSFLVALDAKTGDEVWRVNRAEKSQYSSPIIWQNSLRNELIVGGLFYRSYDPETGELLWQLDMEKGRSSATPVAIGDRLFVGTELRARGGDDDGGGFLFAVKAGGSGDISLAAGAASSEHIVWKTADSSIQMASAAICDGRLYFLERQSGQVHCIDAATGELVYRTRIRGARSFWASPLTSAGRVYCVDSSGTTHVLAGGNDYKLLHSNRVDEQVWSSPSVANGRFYLRTVDHLYCFAAPPQG